jgi:nicotinate-nucleotide adenylyltransferase
MPGGRPRPPMVAAPDRRWQAGAMTRVACFPGSFDPPTIAHLAVAEAAVRQAGLDRIVLLLARRTLGKDHLDAASVERRRAPLLELAADRPWLGVAVTDARLIVDQAEGYDAVVMGADKWAQVVDPAWYGGSVAARDAAVGRLPRVLVAPRAGERPAGVELLDLPDHLADVSATAVREGEPHAAGWALPMAPPTD